MADFEYSINTVAIGNNETNGVRPPGFHSGLPPDTTRPSVEAPHGLHGNGGSYQLTLAALQPRQMIPEEKLRKIAKVHNSSMGHWGHALTKCRLKNLSVIDSSTHLENASIITKINILLFMSGLSESM